MMAITREELKALIASSKQAADGPLVMKKALNLAYLVDAEGYRVTGNANFYDAEFLARSFNLAPELAEWALKALDALEWYAKKEHYDYPETGDYQVAEQPVIDDGGERAREVLACIGKDGEV